MTKRRMFVASLASAAAFIAVLVAGSYIAVQTPYLNAEGTPDNAPIRAAGILLLISPLLFVVVTSFMFAGALLLQHIKQLKPTVIAVIVSVASVGLGFVMILDRPFGWLDALYYFVGFTTFALATITVSALAWWKMAMRPIKTVKRDGPHAANPLQ